MSKKQTTDPKPPANSCNPSDASGFTTPNPVRQVVVTPVETRAFKLPNSETVNPNEFSRALSLVLNTAITSTNVFSPTDPGGGTGDDVCGHRIEIRAGLSDFVLDAFELGVSFGYKGDNDVNSPTSITGKAKMRVGSIAMEFSIWKCTNGKCSAVDSVTSTALNTGASLSAELDFGLIKTGPDLVFNTPFQNTIRTIMSDGMKRLANSPNLSKLSWSWSARVREYIPEAGTLIFDAGLDSGIKPNQSFVIYAVTPAQSACDVFKPVAHVHSTSVELISSSAVIDQVLDPRGVRDGDLVMIRPVDVTHL